MHSKFTVRNFIGFFGLMLMVFMSCTKVPSTELGAGLIPSIDGVITKDTILDVITDTYMDNDSVRVYKNDNQVLGAITNDPLFGKTTASMYFELAPPFFPYAIPGAKDSIRVDSAVLILSYKYAYGDTSTPLKLTVSEIDPATPLISNYNYAANYPSAYTIRTKGTLADPVTLSIPRLKDSVNNRYERASHQIRIKLRSDVARRFISTYDTTNAYRTDSAFKSLFAGFALTVDQAVPTNALIHINLADTNTKFALYYNSSSAGATVRDTAVAYFRFNSFSGGSANLIARNRVGAEIAKFTTTTNKSDSIVYVQSGPGAYVRVRIPGLKGLSNRIIHKAELIAEQVPDDANLFTTDTYMTPPRYLLLSAIDTVENRKYNVPNDYIFSPNQGPNKSNFGGNVLSKSVPGYSKIAAYSFDISRYVQGIVTRKDSVYTLRLSAPTNDSILYREPYPQVAAVQVYYLGPQDGNDVGNGRVRLGGGSHTRFRMRLRIIFSRI
jgi:hypothetical protein